MTGLFLYPKRRLRKLIRDGEYAEAVKFGESIRGNFEGDHDFMFIMGSIYYMVEDPRKALDYFEKAASLGEDVETLKLKANAHLDIGDKDGAEQCCRQVLKIDPKNPEAQSLLEKLEAL
ncbi:MAG: tetratricopeptide repeat protein [Nitrosopumilus sp. H13]|nr:MAG: tetratricopeptide repeat protein [Nitrosopumilus sp. H13]